jgi:hypothetical protein
MPENRWYPSVETMLNGSAMIIGSELCGGFVNSVDQVQSTPTIEFFPKRGTKERESEYLHLRDDAPLIIY